MKWCDFLFQEARCFWKISGWTALNTESYLLIVQMHSRRIASFPHVTPIRMDFIYCLNHQITNMPPYLPHPGRVLVPCFNCRRKRSWKLMFFQVRIKWKSTPWIRHSSSLLPCFNSFLVFLKESKYFVASLQSSPQRDSSSFIFSFPESGECSNSFQVKLWLS